MLRLSLRLPVGRSRMNCMLHAMLYAVVCSVVRCNSPLVQLPVGAFRIEVQLTERNGSGLSLVDKIERSFTVVPPPSAVDAKARRSDRPRASMRRAAAAILRACACA